VEVEDSHDIASDEFLQRTLTAHPPGVIAKPDSPRQNFPFAPDMFAALLTRCCFPSPPSAATAPRPRLGGVEANFWRIVGAMFFLAIWANTLGAGTSGKAFPIFVLSGLPASASATPRIFRRCRDSAAARTVLLTQCLIAPCAALIEWLLARHPAGPRGNFLRGGDSRRRGHRAGARRPFENRPAPVLDRLLACAIAALGGALAAVLSAKPTSSRTRRREHPDPGTTATSASSAAPLRSVWFS